MEILQRTGTEGDLMKSRLDKWLTSVPNWHDHFVWSPIQKTAWTPPKKPLNQCRVALVTSGGVYLRNQEPFDIVSDYGDWSYREIPSDTDPGDFMISDAHYDHSEPDEDINCIFPISHVWSLVRDGVIASVAKNFYTFMGFIPDPGKLIAETAPQVAAKLVADHVDVVFLTPG